MCTVVRNQHSEDPLFCKEYMGDRRQQNILYFKVVVYLDPARHYYVCEWVSHTFPIFLQKLEFAKKMKKTSSLGPTPHISQFSHNHLLMTHSKKKLMEMNDGDDDGWWRTTTRKICIGTEDTGTIYSIYLEMPSAVEIVGAGNTVRRFFRGHEWKNLDDHFPELAPLYTGKTLVK